MSPATTPATTLRSALAAPGHGRRMMRGAAGTFVLNVVSSALNLVIAIVLSHVLGLEGYGAVAFATALVMLLAVPGVVGLDRLLTREVAVHDRRDERAEARALIGGARLMTLITSVALGGIGAGVTLALAGGHWSVTVLCVLVGLLALPFATWNRVQQGATLGVRRIAAAQAPEMVVRPSALLALVGAAVLLLGTPLPAVLVMMLHVASFAVAVAVGGILLLRFLPPGTEQVARRLPRVRSALPFAVLGGAAVVNNQSGVVLVGLLSSTEAAGLYGAAARLALLVPFALTAVNAVLAPTAARLWDAGEIAELQRVVTLSARATLVLSVPATLAFILFGSWFLDLAFPPAFTAAAPALAILAVGQLINASMGSVGTLLTMSGQADVAAAGVTAGAAVMVALSVVLIPSLGVNGAAIASALSLTTWNVWLAVEARRRLGIDSTALGLHPSTPGSVGRDASGQRQPR